MENSREFNETYYPQNAEPTASKVKSQLADAAQTAKDKIMETGQHLADKMEQTRHTAAQSLNDAATTLHETGPKLTRATDAAAGKLEATANYLRGHDFEAMVGDVENFVRRYPGESLAVAAAAGFLVARMLRTKAA